MSRRPTLTEVQLRVTHQAASLLLSYPDGALLDRLGLLREAVGGLPRAVAAPLGHFLDHVAATPPSRLAADYVATFDLRRRCCLYLTYFTHGDTRKRGAALLRVRRVYREAGLEPDGRELPDHLAVVLELSARGHVAAATHLLTEHRAGLELLRQALRELRSPYTDVVDAVRVTLDTPPPGVLAAARRLAREGPPAESVGIDGAEPPAMHPSAPSAGGPR